jgi:hypothetical protein
MGIKMCTEICKNTEDYPVNLSHTTYTKYFTNPSKQCIRHQILTEKKQYFVSQLHTQFIFNIGNVKLI